MLRINGTFKMSNVKETNSGSKYMNITNSTKQQDGTYTSTYYTLWLTDKVSSMFTVEMKKKLTDGYIIANIEGYLNVSKNGNFTNLTIIPKEITEKEFNSQ